MFYFIVPASFSYTKNVRVLKHASQSLQRTEVFQDWWHVKRRKKKKTANIRRHRKEGRKMGNTQRKRKKRDCGSTRGLQRLHESA